MWSKYNPKRESPVSARSRAQWATVTAAETATRTQVRAAAQAAARPKESKYHNRKTSRVVDGKRVMFDSQREANRWDELCLLLRAGKIQGLERQVPFLLIPAQKDADGKVIEKAVRYIADFVYTDAVGHKIVEDAKGRKTPEYIIKRKLMLERHGIKVREV